MITLRYNPYLVFAASNTPFGIYARQKWIGLEKDVSWQADFENCAASLLEGQLVDGSWGKSFLLTAQRVFGLHLTVRNPTERINSALNWLFDRAINADIIDYLDKDDEINAVSLCNLPFVPGDRRLLYLSIALFFCTIFNRAASHEVVAQYKELSRRVLKEESDVNNNCNISNIMRALVVHPVFAEDSATMLLVGHLSKIQEDSGVWPVGIPFYMTVNALAHLNNPHADRQLDKAFSLLADTQNPDGTWGDNEKEWNTFLVVHALRNKKILQ